MTIQIIPLLAIIVGIVCLAAPRHSNFAIAIFLITYGMIRMAGLGS